jgi:hypothetical protein
MDKKSICVRHTAKISLIRIQANMDIDHISYKMLDMFLTNVNTSR